jgi:hypothetical protein
MELKSGACLLFRNTAFLKKARLILKLNFTALMLVDTFGEVKLAKEKRE